MRDFRAVGSAARRLWDEARYYADKAWDWVNKFTNGPLLALILMVVVMVLLLAACEARADGSTWVIKQDPTSWRTGGWDPIILKVGAAASQSSGEGLLVDINDPDTEMLAGPGGRLVLCQSKEDKDFVHLCQGFQLLSPQMMTPVQGAIYCFVEKEEEVIQNGVPQPKKSWICGRDRRAIADKAAALKRGAMNQWNPKPKGYKIST